MAACYSKSGKDNARTGHARTGAGVSDSTETLAGILRLLTGRTRAVDRAIRFGRREERTRRAAILHGIGHDGDLVAGLESGGFDAGPQQGRGSFGLKTPELNLAI